MSKLTDIQLYNIICWEGDGLLFRILSPILSIFEPTWRKRKFKPWHMTWVYGQYSDGDWKVIEATFPRVRTMALSVLKQIYGKNYKNYHWFNLELNKDSAEQFVRSREGAKYDGMVYAWTILQYIVAKYFHKEIPRFLNDSYDCWELVEEICDCFGKPWASTHTIQHRYPLISDFLNEVEN